MTGDRTGDLIFYALAIVLPLSALIARRPAIGMVLKSIVGWIVIFGIGLVLFSQRDRLSGMTAGLLSEQKVTGGETRIRQSADGHFWADVTINGVARRMLIDSGATTTALSLGTAQAAGIDTEASPFPAILNTANGQITARTAIAKRVEIGNVRATDLGVVVSPTFGNTDVIGMNFLSKLKSWRVERRVLVLTPDVS